MIETNSYYWYGVTMAVYLVTCWMFSAVRAFHHCGTPKERRDYIWPDRKMQVGIYLTSVVLLPYVLNPHSEAAWLLVKYYFPCTYYYYCASLIFCFFGTVRQWKIWKTTNLIAGFVTAAAMLPFVLHAWLPSGLLTPQGIWICNVAAIVVCALMVIYCGLALWQVWIWMRVSRDVNYSNPDDFPMEYARRMWFSPIILTPFLWPPFITDSPKVMAIMCIPLAVFNVVLLLNVMPIWRRAAILSDIEDEEMVVEENSLLAEERNNRIAAEIEQFVNTEAAYLDPHLKLEQVVERCSFSRIYVSRVLTERFGSFFNYVNGLRLDYYDHYMAQHPNSTKEAAAEASGFTSYKAYTNVRERLPR